MEDKRCKDSSNREVPGAYNTQYLEEDDSLQIDEFKGQYDQETIVRESTQTESQLDYFNQIQDSFTVAPGSPRLLGIEYTEGYLRTIIGKRVSVTFFLGTSSSTDRSGILTAVGIDYIVLRQLQTNTDVLCDMYSIKFVNIYD